MNVQEAMLRERMDPYLTPDRLAELAGGPVSGYQLLTGGCWNRVIGVQAGGRDVVLKISPHDNDENIIREHSVLEVFARETELPVPRPIRLDAGGPGGKGTDGKDGGVLPGTTLVMSRVPGRVMHECFAYLDSSDRSRLIDEIAEDITALHEHRGRGFGGVELPPEERLEVWPDFWLPRLDRVLDEAEQSEAVPRGLLAEARELRPHLYSLLDIGADSVLTHYDIWAGNVMIDIDADPPRVSGYIDVPGFYADYARELSFAMLFGIADERFLETYGRRHVLDDGFRLRTHIYNLRTNLKHIQMYPSEPIYRNGAVQNLHAIRRAI